MTAKVTGWPKASAKGPNTALPTGVSYVRDGSLRALGMFSSRRASALPGVPTIGEATGQDMPADIVGTNIMVEDEKGGRHFQFQAGPIFANILLADEVNRATPKTQSALLEGMQEKAVTTGGQSRPLPRPFFVLATQNPIEMEGTYPLPEAQLDRFLMRISLGYPDHAAERALRGVALGRKNWLFAGSDVGGHRAAAIYSLIETCKLNDIDPRAYLTYVLMHIAGHNIHRIEDAAALERRQAAGPHGASIELTPLAGGSTACRTRAPCLRDSERLS